MIIDSSKVDAMRACIGRTITEVLFDHRGSYRVLFDDGSALWVHEIQCRYTPEDYAQFSPNWPPPRMVLSELGDDWTDGLEPVINLTGELF